jgi:hypothetical protein
MSEQVEVQGRQRPHSVTRPFRIHCADAAPTEGGRINGTTPFPNPETAERMARDSTRCGGSAQPVRRATGRVLGTDEPWPLCKNCGQRYDPTDRSDLDYGAFVGPRYCGSCGATEARIVEQHGA